jgi:N-acetylmuramoyl-L-alanine amidase
LNKEIFSTRSFSHGLVPMPDLIVSTHRAGNSARVGACGGEEPAARCLQLSRRNDRDGFFVPGCERGETWMAAYRRSGLLAVILALAAVGLAACGGASPPPLANSGNSDGEGSRTEVAASSSGAGVGIDPAYFSPGACVAFPPTNGNRHLTVFLDAGHGGLDPGAVGSTESGRVIYEADQTLPVVLDAMTILRRAGFRVVVSRTRPTTVLRLGPGDVSGHLLTDQGVHDDVAARDVCANMAHANVLVGVYFNAGASTANAGCITAYDDARPFAAENRRLADLVQSDVLAAMNAQGWQIPDIGAQTDQGLGSSLTAADEAYDHLLLLGPAKKGYFGTPSAMPGALIEPLFITDPFEGSIAASSRGQRVIAAGLAQAIEQYFA